METIRRRQAQPSYTLFAAVIGGGSLLVSFAIAAIAWRMADAPKAVATEEKPRAEAKAPEVKPAAPIPADAKIDAKAFAKIVTDRLNVLVRMGKLEETHTRRVIAEQHATKLGLMGNRLQTAEGCYNETKSLGAKQVSPEVLKLAYEFSPTSVSLMVIGTPASYNSAPDVEDMSPTIHQWLLDFEKADPANGPIDPAKHVDLNVSRELHDKFKPSAVSSYRRMFLAGWRYYLISSAIKDGHGIDGFEWVKLRGKNIRPENVNREADTLVFFHVIRGILPEARRERFDRCIPAIPNENPVQFITSMACKSLE